MSSVMVPMTTRVFSGRERAARRESDRGGRLIRDMKRRRRTTRLKGEVVRPVDPNMVRLRLRVILLGGQEDVRARKR